MSKESHLERTAKEPRDVSLHRVIIREIDEINDSIRVFRLETPDDGMIKFLPGQWLDVYVPTVAQAGGFTITSPPSAASPPSDSKKYAYLELAIQKSPSNPPAAWLWQQPPSSILQSVLHVRVGGAFVYPPFPLKPEPIRKVIFLAGGVGINPLTSMLSSIADLNNKNNTPEVHFFYSVKNPPSDVEGPFDSKRIHFLDRIAGLFSPFPCPDGCAAPASVKGKFKLFLTSGTGTGPTPTTPPDEKKETIPCCNGRVQTPFLRRRITKQDVASALGLGLGDGDGDDQEGTYVYVCGVPSMTDQFVRELTSPVETGGLGMEADRVLFEKWW
ncbi:hypothetical protein B0H66DRAFT_548694 [Apodospora peruviana]|uniref:FAD-binding FR-type domain-containing protein n=1 Tax=Apodospora peruviana TaxID=516989 RepID=A0AAE0MAP8_9PEZI|nr:hypothetical protein B0H66DRAFT_548694 [Apodospora peruviana]